MVRRSRTIRTFAVIIWVLGVVAITLLPGCVQPRREKEMSVYVDPDTGCEYIKYKGTYETSITPRMYFSQYHNRNEQKGCKP